MSGAVAAPVADVRIDRGPWRGWRADLLAAVPGWVAGRALTLVSLLVAHLAVDRFRDDPAPPQLDQGLFAWDGTFYRSIAEVGYVDGPFEAVRFYPLYPRLALSAVGLLVLGWAAALVAGAVVHRLALALRDDAVVARRAALLVGISPPSFVLVWAYSEGLFLALAGGCLLALHRRRWWAAGLLGALAALCRPVGLLLALPAVLEGLRGLRTASAEERTGRAVAVLAPVAATVGWLAWTARAFDDPLVALDVQEGLRGGFVDPVSRLGEGLGELFTDTLGDGLHIPFALGLVALCVACARTFPAGQSAFATVVVVVALSAENLNSLERYALGAAPLVVALAALPRRRWHAVVLLTTSALGFVGFCTLAWYGSYVP